MNIWNNAVEEEVVLVGKRSDNGATEQGQGKFHTKCVKQFYRIQ